MERDLEENVPCHEKSSLLVNGSKGLVKAESYPGSYDGYQSRSPAQCHLQDIRFYTEGLKDTNELTPRKPLQRKAKKDETGTFFHYLIYAAINIILSVPCLYGYAAVIFNNPIFNPHINSLSKLVIFSSFIHQLGFTLFSSLPFAIGTVQDAGLIFLSAMSNTIAQQMDGKTDQQILSTTLVMLCGGTAMLGLVLIFMGRLRIANAVSYLPLPVVGGYLAFIGYFCLEAGVSLCISKPMMDLSDWGLLLQPNLFLLALPGLIAGIVLTLASRSTQSVVILPVAMVVIPALFYVFIFAAGWGLDGAREYKLVGEKSDPVPIQSLFHLVDFSVVDWSVATSVFPIWLGMVFVVSFASSLDIAAISMDMGEALDTNKELETVGVANLLSGLSFGFTGSYIFSQTIFTYRTKCHSRWIGILVMVAYIVVVVAKQSLLELVPLFFLGSTLIFIGYDLVYEWIFEVRHKLIWSEYAVLLLTFLAIHVVGIDFGIIIGVVIAVVDYVRTTAQASTISRVQKRSRAIWQPNDWKLLQTHGYGEHPKIITLEVKGPVFFGSSMQLLSFISEEIGIDESDEDVMDMSLISPHIGAHLLKNKDVGTPISTPKNRRVANSKRDSQPRSFKDSKLKHRPDFLVLDLSQTTNLDATAARGCFLQLAKMCAKRSIIVCATGLHPRIDWMLRSHDVAHSEEDEKKVKQKILESARRDTPYNTGDLEKLFLFVTVYEGLEFCENNWIERFNRRSSPFLSKKTQRPSFIRLDELAGEDDGSPATKQTLSHVFSYILGLDQSDKVLLDGLEQADVTPFHTEVTFKERDVIFQKGSVPDAFFVVLSGSIALTKQADNKTVLSQSIISGAGQVRVGSKNELIDQQMGILSHESAILRVGGIFSFVDFILERPRTFEAHATADNTVVAVLYKTRLDSMKAEHPELIRIIQSVLLQASVLELANCTCSV